MARSTICANKTYARVVALGSLALVSLGLAASSPAALTAAALPPSPLPLAFVAVGQTAGFFEAAMPAGTAQNFRVKLTNPGQLDVTARTYKADVFTLTNGGFGAKTSSDTPSGASEWVDYPQQTPTVLAGKELFIPFSVTVPANTAPGRYLSSVVLENLPAAAGLTTGGSSQVVRTAMAVSVRVPGALHPAISIGAVQPIQEAGRTGFAVTLSNTGNELIKPTVELKLINSAGHQVWKKSVTMGSFYAKTSTTVQPAGSVALLAGAYTFAVTASDTAGGLSPVSATRKLVLSGVEAVAAQRVVPLWITLLGFAAVLAGSVIAIKKWGHRFPRFSRKRNGS